MGLRCNLAHMVAPRAVHVRFTAFMTQVAIATYWAVRLLTS